MGGVDCRAQHGINGGAGCCRDGAGGAGGGGGGGPGGPIGLIL